MSNLWLPQKIKPCVWEHCPNFLNSGSLRPWPLPNVTLPWHTSVLFLWAPLTVTREKCKDLCTTQYKDLKLDYFIKMLKNFSDSSKSILWNHKSFMDWPSSLMQLLRSFSFNNVNVHLYSLSFKSGGFLWLLWQMSSFRWHLLVVYE